MKKYLYTWLCWNNSIEKGQYSFCDRIDLLFPRDRKFYWKLSYWNSLRCNTVIRIWLLHVRNLSLDIFFVKRTSAFSICKIKCWNNASMINTIDCQFIQKFKISINQFYSYCQLLNLNQYWLKNYQFNLYHTIIRFDFYNKNLKHF